MMVRYYKTLRLMAEYECWCIWNIDDRGCDRNIDPSILSLPTDLSKDLEVWMDAFESTYNKCDPASSGFSTFEELATFNKKGENLLLRLRHAIPQTDWRFVAAVK